MPPVGREGLLERVRQAVPLRRFVATGALYTGFEFDPTWGRQCRRCRYARTVRRYRGQLFGGQARPRYRARHGDYEGCDRAPTVRGPVLTAVFGMRGVCHVRCPVVRCAQAERPRALSSLLPRIELRCPTTNRHWRVAYVRATKETTDFVVRARSNDSCIFSGSASFRK